MKLSVALPRRLGGEIEVNFQPELNAMFWFLGIMADVWSLYWYAQGILLMAVLILQHTLKRR